MNNAFRDQLLKTGLATKKQVKAATHEENVGRRKRRKKNRGASEDAPQVDAAEAALEAKRARDKALNQQRDAARQAQALEAEVDDLIARNILKDTRGEIGYKFADGGTVKTLYVTAAVQRALSDGETGIVWKQENYCLVPRATALSIEERVPERLVLLNDSDEPSDQDDPYADYKVPDDLMW